MCGMDSNRRTFGANLAALPVALFPNPTDPVRRSVPISSVPGAWIASADGVVLERDPAIPAELPVLAGRPCDTVLEAADRCWRVRAVRWGDDYIIGVAHKL